MNAIRKFTRLGLSFYFVAALCHSVSAASITDTVVIDDKEWAQVTLFTNLSWNQINAVCAGGSCGDGSLNGFEMLGWHWATRNEVGDLLFAPGTAHPGGIASIIDDPGVLNEWSVATGFNYTDDDFSFDIDGFISGGTSGLTSDKHSVDRGGKAVILFLDDTIIANTVINSATASNSLDESLSDVGAWFYRPVVVPIPPAVALFCLPAYVLMRRKRTLC